MALAVIPRPAPASAATPLGTNLIVNPGAELGTAGDGSGDPPPDWTTTGDFTQILYSEGDGYPTLTTPGPPSPGTAFFGGGYPGSGSGSTATQTISISDLASQVDADAVGYNLSGWLGGYLTDADSIEVVLTFENASGASLGTGQIGPVTAAMRDDTTELLSQASSGSVPVGTRTIKVEMITDWVNGSSDDGYADDLALTLDAINTVTVTRPPAQSATVGSPFTLPISATDSDPSQTLTYAATGLPAGLSIDAATGEISGTPQAAENSTVTVKATDSTGSVGSAAFTIATTRVPGDLSVAATLSPASAGGSSGWYTGPVTVTPTTSGQDGSVQINAAVDGASPAMVTGPLTLSGDGTHTVTLTATDAAGDIAAPDTFTVRIDSTAPTSTASFEPASRTVQITAADATSGVASIQYQLNGGAWTTASTGSTGASVPVGAGRATIGYRALDTAGNVEAGQSLVVPSAGPSGSTVVLSAPTTVAYGHAATARITVTAPAQTPGGTVTVSNGPRRIGVFALTGGAVSVPLPRTMPVAAEDRLTVVYSGDAGAGASTATGSVDVTRAAVRLGTQAELTSGKLDVAVTATVPGTTVVVPVEPVTVSLTGHGLPRAGLLRRARLVGGRVVVSFGAVRVGDDRLTVRIPRTGTLAAAQTSRRLHV